MTIESVGWCKLCCDKPRVTPVLPWNQIRKPKFLDDNSNRDIGLTRPWERPARNYYQSITATTRRILHPWNSSSPLFAVLLLRLINSISGLPEIEKISQDTFRGTIYHWENIHKYYLKYYELFFIKVYCAN